MPNSVQLEQQLIEAARALIFGPEKRFHEVNGHIFHCKPATIARESSGRTLLMNGQLSHHLGGKRPDDQIYYSIHYVNGVATSENIQIDHGGISAMAKVVLDAIPISIDEIRLGVVTVKLNLQNIPQVITEISKIVEGRGWEGQASAIITFSSILASKPKEEINQLLRFPDANRGNNRDRGEHVPPPRRPGDPVQAER